MLHPDRTQIARLLELPLEENRLPDRCPVEAAYRLFDVLGANEYQISSRDLSLPESERCDGEFREVQTQQIYRVAAAWLMTAWVFGDPEKARRFLARPHPLLSGRVPIKMAIASEADLEALRRLLGRLYFGAAA